MHGAHVKSVGCLADSPADFIPRVKPHFLKPESQDLNKDKPQKSEYRATQQGLVQSIERVMTSNKKCARGTHCRR